MPALHPRGRPYRARLAAGCGMSIAATCPGPAAAVEDCPGGQQVAHSPKPPSAWHRPSRRRVTVHTNDGVRLSCSDFGDPTAHRTVVFLHGLCLSELSWSRHIDYLLHRYSGAVRVNQLRPSRPRPLATRAGRHVSHRPTRRRLRSRHHRPGHQRFGDLGRAFARRHGGPGLP